MTETTTPSRLTGLLPDISATVLRFPAAVLIAIVYTIYHLANPPEHHSGIPFFDLVGLDEVNVFSGFLTVSFFWIVATDLYVETHGRSWPLRIALWVCGVVAIYLLVQFPEVSWLAWGPLFGALVLSVGLTAYLRRGTDATFWLFNQQLWLGWFLAQIGAVLLALGLSAILASLNILFGLELPDVWYDNVRVVAFGLVANLAFLAFVPRRFDEVVEEGWQTGFVSRAVAVIAKFILVPLLLAYTAILYAYAAKIGWQGFLPKGEVAGMVVAYIVAGTITLLLAFPTRESGGALVRFTWRYWLWLAVLPVLLLFLALYERIEAYGVTEVRYVLALAGVWILILATAKVVQQSRFDVRLIPGVLAVLLLVASFGPWGAKGFSARSQAAELAAILTAQGKLIDRRLVANPALSGDQSRAASILWHLYSQDALHILAPWFEGREQSPFAPGKTPSHTYSEIAKALVGAPETHVTTSTGSLEGRAPLVIDGPAYSWIVAPIGLNTTNSTTHVDIDDLGTLHLELADGVLTVRSEAGHGLRFDIFSEVDKEWRAKTEQPIALRGTGEGLTGTAWLTQISFTTRNGFVAEITGVELWLGIARAE